MRRACVRSAHRRLTSWRSHKGWNSRAGAVSIISWPTHGVPAAAIHRQALQPARCAPPALPFRLVSLHRLIPVCACTCMAYARSLVHARARAGCRTRGTVSHAGARRLPDGLGAPRTHPTHPGEYRLYTCMLPAVCCIGWLHMASCMLQRTTYATVTARALLLFCLFQRATTYYTAVLLPARAIYIYI
jgi:hypothetical protein